MPISGRLQALQFVQVAVEYDSWGRFSSVSSVVASTTSMTVYAYLANSDLVAGWDSWQAGSSVTNSTRRYYEPHRDLIVAISNLVWYPGAGWTVESSFTYTNDALGRRTARLDAADGADTVTNFFAYNLRSELTSASMGTNTYCYAYDPIGNRTATTINDEELTYTANGLNQYTLISDGVTNTPTYDADGNMLTSGGGWYIAVTADTNQIVVTDAGDSDPNAWGVYVGSSGGANVNGWTWLTYGDPFFCYITDPDQWVIYDGGSNTPVIPSDWVGEFGAVGLVHVEYFALVTNTIALPSWSYSWDAENRMVGAFNNTITATYAYDGQSRRCQKVVGATTNTFVYDGWNPIREVSVSDGGTTTNLYVWGLDLSGTLQGAGGVGGLLFVTRDGTTYYPCYDANGNITDYVDANGTVVAHREFDAFGNTIVATGPLVHDLHFWFSTKYLDEETGLYYYGYRYFAPGLGRWLSRDPIQEQGGAYVISLSMPVDMFSGQSGFNLNSFVENCPIDRFDLFGLAWTVTRDNSKPKATATVEDDTVTSLATMIGLNVVDYQKWLTIDDTGGIPTATEKIKCRQFKVPNVVYAYWAGDKGSVGKWWVDWGSSVDYLRSLGFGVIAVDHKDGNNYVLQGELQMAASDKVLHGLYFWGHGWKPYPSSGLTCSHSDYILDYASASLSYKMALGLVFACDSNSGKTLLSSGTGGSIWHGYTGTLYPIWPGLIGIGGYYIDGWIHHGDQATKCNRLATGGGRSVRGKAEWSLCGGLEFSFFVLEGTFVI